MTTRVLPPEEWPRLAGTDTASVIAHLSPQDLSIVALEDRGRIVGACALLWMPQIEGAWIAPEYRGWPALRLLLSTAWRLIPGRWVITSALSDAVRRRLRRLGGRQLPGTYFMLSTTEERVCRHWQR